MFIVSRRMRTAHPVRGDMVLRRQDIALLWSAALLACDSINIALLWSACTPKCYRPLRSWKGGAARPDRSARTSPAPAGGRWSMVGVFKWFQVSLTDLSLCRQNVETETSPWPRICGSSSGCQTTLEPQDDAETRPRILQPVHAWRVGLLARSR